MRDNLTLRKLGAVGLKSVARGGVPAALSRPLCGLGVTARSEGPPPASHRLGYHDDGN